MYSSILSDCKFLNKFNCGALKSKLLSVVFDKFCKTFVISVVSALIDLIFYL